MNLFEYFFIRLPISEENILISFHVNNQTIETFGYLTQGYRGLIESKQQESISCKKIRKYN